MNEIQDFCKIPFLHCPIVIFPNRERERELSSLVWFFFLIEMMNGDFVVEVYNQDKRRLMMIQDYQFNWFIIYFVIRLSLPFLNARLIYLVSLYDIITHV